MLIAVSFTCAACSLSHPSQNDRSKDITVRTLLDQLPEKDGVYWDNWSIYCQEAKPTAAIRSACFKTENNIYLFECFFAPDHEASALLMVFSDEGEFKEYREWLSFGSRQGERFRLKREGGRRVEYFRDQSKILDYVDPPKSLPSLILPGILKAKHNGTLSSDQFRIVDAIAYGRTTHHNEYNIQEINVHSGLTSEPIEGGSIYGVTVTRHRKEEVEDQRIYYVLRSDGSISISWHDFIGSWSATLKSSKEDIFDLWTLPKEISDISELKDNFD